MINVFTLKKRISHFSFICVRSGVTFPSRRSNSGRTREISCSEILHEALSVALTQPSFTFKKRCRVSSCTKSFYHFMQRWRQSRPLRNGTGEKSWWMDGNLLFSISETSPQTCGGKQRLTSSCILETMFFLRVNNPSNVRIHHTQNETKLQSFGCVFRKQLQYWNFWIVQWLFCQTKLHLLSLWSIWCWVEVKTPNYKPQVDHMLSPCRIFHVLK